MMGVYLDNFGWRDFMLQFVETLNEFIQPKHKNLTLEYHTSYIIRYNETDEGTEISLLLFSLPLCLYRHSSTGHHQHDDNCDLTINCCLNSIFSGHPFPPWLT